LSGRKHTFNRLPRQPEPPWTLGHNPLGLRPQLDAQAAPRVRRPSAVPETAGFHDVMGNAWEWGEDHYSAFPGFKVHPVYEDFSAPCFAGKHQLVSPDHDQMPCKHECL